MDTQSTPSQPDPSSAAVGHETTDAGAGYVAALTLALSLVAAFGLVASYWIYGTFERSAALDEPAANRLTGSQVPPEPRLQAAPRTAYQELRRRQEAQMSRYEWVNREQGTVRIPVERAVELLAERGFPAPVPAATAAASQEGTP